MNVLPKWSPKNPLEVIAIFIALIYGICALLLGAAVGTLEKYNQTAMVWFIILFPVAVLAVFGWLVRNHHTKLYAPGDYRSDDAFHGAQAAPGSLAPRLEDEMVEPGVGPVVVADEAPDTDQPPLEGRAVPEVDLPQEHEIEIATTLPRSPGALDAYLVEGLAFQELQKEFNGSVRRHLTVPTINGGKRTIDGILETPEGTAIVEVRTLLSQSHASRRIRDLFSNLSEIDRTSIFRGARLIAVFVVESEIQRIRLSASIYESQKNFGNIDVRVFVYSNLMQKYGFRQ